MGYDSTFSGSLHPKKKIPDDLVKIINGWQRDVCVQMPEDEDADGEPGDIIPSSRDMHGYNIAEDVFRVTRFLKEHGISLSGEIFRVGENADDYERISVKSGRVYTAAGEIVYSGKREITAENITHHAVRLINRETKKFYGWLTHDALKKTYKTVRCNKSHDTLPPPLHAAWFESREDAVSAAGHAATETIACEIVDWEDKL